MDSNHSLIKVSDLQSDCHIQNDFKSPTKTKSIF